MQSIPQAFSLFGINLRFCCQLFTSRCWQWCRFSTKASDYQKRGGKAEHRMQTYSPAENNSTSYFFNESFIFTQIIFLMFGSLFMSFLEKHDLGYYIKKGDDMWRRFNITATENQKAKKLTCHSQWKVWATEQRLFTKRWMTAKQNKKVLRSVD